MSLFRCAGDILFDNVEPFPGQRCGVSVKELSETHSFLQYLNPLTSNHPYFCAQIKTLACKSCITIGIASPDIAANARPGQWINSVGYHGESGKCFSSHESSGNGSREKLAAGDVLGVLVTYFGESASTVVFFKNGNPVATRFLFEADHGHFLPTISLQHGLVSLDLLWPEAVVDVPRCSLKDRNQWILPQGVVYSSDSNTFRYDGKQAEVHIHSSSPLSTEISHYEVIVQEASSTGYGPFIGIAACSPLLPSPPIPLLNEALSFHPTGENVGVKVGDRIGWGVHYHRPARSHLTFDPGAQQLVLCYVTINMSIVYHQVAMQPVGGFFPVVSLNSHARTVMMEVMTSPLPKSLFTFLDQSLEQLYQDSVNLVSEAQLASRVEQTRFRYSESLEGLMSEPVCRLRLPASAKGIHVIQFLSPLTEDCNYVCCQVRKLNKNSVVSIGVAGLDFPLDKLPGSVRPSVGWHSRQGKIIRNDRTDSNLAGHKFGKGDFIGMEVEIFAREMSVVLFSLNSLPVGTSYYTQVDRDDFLPTIGLCSNGYDIEIDVCWHNMNRGSRNWDLKNPEHWCLPSGATVDKEHNMVSVPQHSAPTAIQAPYSFRKGFNHFEICLVDDFGEDVPPPAVVLCTATPLDPPPVSNFRLDFLRFWAINEAAQTVRKGDLVGWGITYLGGELPLGEEQLVVCYLTVNRHVVLVRVVYQPPGGFYPLVILPQGVERVQLEFSCLCFDEHPFSKEDMDFLINDAKELIVLEEEAILQGVDPHDLQIDMARLFRAPPNRGKIAMSRDAKHLPMGQNQTWQHHHKQNRLVTVVRDVKSNTKLRHNGQGRASQAQHIPINISGTGGIQKDSRSCVML